MTQVRNQKLVTAAAPQPVGPYSQAVKSGSAVYIAGQMGLDPATGTLVEGGIEAQARQVMKNLSAIAEAAGGSLDDAVKTTVFLRDFDDFGAMNSVYAEYFGVSSPARSTVEVSRLPLGAIVEIEAVLMVGG